MTLPIPIGTDRPQRRVPLMNILLIAANVAIYFFSHTSPMPGELHPDPSNLSPFFRDLVLSAADPKLYQFITYQFLHQNAMHIFGNMLFLYVFGNNLNEKLGNIAYLAFYLAGGVLAGCGQLLMAHAPTLGASGSISAVTGLFFVLLPRTNVKVFFWLFFYFDVFLIPSMYFILLNFFKDIFEPFLFSGSHVAYQAHLTGTFAGFLVGVLLLGTGLVQRDHYDLLALINRYRRRKEYERLVAKGYDPYDPAAPLRPTASAAPTMRDPRIAVMHDRIIHLVRTHDLPAAAMAYVELRQIDPVHVLPPAEQLDIANQLMSEAHHGEAATAYEDYLKTNPTGPQADQVFLILGLIYARYVVNVPRAIELLQTAVRRLHDPGQRALAEAELHLLEPPAP